MERIIVNSKGLAALKEKLSSKLTEYDKLRMERQTAFELAGDGWHDNPYLNKLMQEEAEITKLIVEIRGQIELATVIDVKDGERPAESVRYGSIVELFDQISCTTQVWEIVGFEQTNQEQRQLAYSSPLGRALLGKQPGETVDWGNGSSLEVIELHDDWHSAKAVRS